MAGGDVEALELRIRALEAMVALLLAEHVTEEWATGMAASLRGGVARREKVVAAGAVAHPALGSQSDAGLVTATMLDRVVDQIRARRSRAAGG